MQNDDITIRAARLEDAQEILNIYSPYVTDTAITFEYEVPTLDEFRTRMLHIMGKYPYLVAVWNGEIAGYCYASQFKDRDAYNWSVETTIYIRRNMKRNGIGAMLYEKLEELLDAQHILNLNACIAYPHPESIAFHEKMGYKLVGHFHKCGYKLGGWYDMVWMEKMLGEHTEEPLPVTGVRSETCE